MAYVYCLKPEKMKGKFLYPLKKLRTFFPEKYKEVIKRYGDRKDVPKKDIHPLNCKFEDVIHLTPVHPSKISKELRKAGHNTKKKKWYKIPAKMLEPEKTTIYLYKYKKDPSKIMAPNQFTNFSSSKILKYKEIPERTKKHYKKEKYPLDFHFIPHVFYKEKIDTSKCEVIEA